MLLGVEAGEHAGGDTEGALSAALVVHAQEEYPLWDVRIDDADDPAERLRQIYTKMKEQLLPEILKMPTRQDAMGQAAREQLTEG